MSYKVLVNQDHSSGTTEHSLECHGNFKWLHSNATTRETNYRQKKNTGSFRNKKKATLDENIKLLNRDEGKLVSVNTWTPLFARQRNQDISDAK